MLKKIIKLLGDLGSHTLLVMDGIQDPESPELEEILRLPVKILIRNIDIEFFHCIHIASFSWVLSSCIG